MSADEEPASPNSSGRSNSSEASNSEPHRTGSESDQTPTSSPARDEGAGLSSKRSRPYLLPVVAVLAVAAVLIALMFGGVIPGFLGPAKSSSSTPSSLDYTQAASVAKSTSDNSGGSWSVFSGAAVGLASTVTIPGALFTDLSANLTTYGCDVSWAGNVVTDGLAIPATPSTAAQGNANFWFFVLTATSGALQVVTVSNGTGAILVTLTGLVCALLGEELHAAGANSLDSPQAIAVANAHGGATFLASHPQAARTWALTGTASALNLTQSDWNVVYTMCPTSGDEPAAPEPSFNATLSATSGAVLSSQTTNVTCGSFSLTNLTLGHLGSSVHHVHPLGTMSGFSLSWPGSGLPTGLGVAGKQ